MGLYVGKLFHVESAPSSSLIPLMSVCPVKGNGITTLGCRVVLSIDVPGEP